MAKVADSYFERNPWKIIERGFDPAYARVSESVFALANETLGLRGYFDEGGTPDSLRGSYVNGLYALSRLPGSYKGIVDKTHFMVPATDWLRTGIKVDGEALDLGTVAFEDFTRELDMQKGTLTRRFVWHTATGKALRLTFIRFIDMRHDERAYQRVTLEALNFSGTVEMTAGIGFATEHEGRRTCFFGETQCEIAGHSILTRSHIPSSDKELFTALLWDVPGGCKGKQSDTAASLVAILTLEQGKALHVDRRVAVVFDGTAGEELWATGQKALQMTAACSFDEALAAQEAYWAEHWRLSDVVIEPRRESDREAVEGEQQGIRFCSFQMAQTYKGGSVRHNIGAKGLTGEAYNGHAFWDTEACCLPFYLFTNPEAAKSLLMFRYNTLPQALLRARMLDCEGACYPVATLNGDEACDLWQHASLQFQPSTAVAYGIRHYVLVTGDEDFLWKYGAEMLLQIARFLASRAAQNPHNGAYGYYGVMGPDEFHMMVHNNAYTNYMSKRSLAYAAEVLDGMAEKKPALFRRLAARTELGAEETAKWRDIETHMALPGTEEGLFEQHDGYFDLPHMDIHAIPVSEFPLYNHWSYDRIYRSDMIKQPDVLMFLYLYNSSFPAEVKRRNYLYYEPRTIHESSLSPAVHSILAAELGFMQEATDFFGYATRLDLDNYNRNTREGLHTTSIAMAWVNIVYGFAGLRSDEKPLRFAPRLPERWKELRFSLLWQGRILDIEMECGQTRFTLRQGEPMELLVYGKQYRVGAESLLVPADTSHL